MPDQICKGIEKDVFKLFFPFPQPVSSNGVMLAVGSLVGTGCLLFVKVLVELVKVINLEI